MLWSPFPKLWPPEAELTGIPLAGAQPGFSRYRPGDALEIVDRSVPPVAGPGQSDLGALIMLGAAKDSRADASLRYPPRMFRQVVSQTWAAGVTEDQKRGFIEALTALGAIPEVVSIRVGTDVGFFEGNYHVVTVLDFADFASARRYVEHADHQAFVATWSQLCTDKRVIVQHEWGVGTVVGLHHLKLPVTDVARSRQWYVEALGFVPDLEFVEDGILRGVALAHGAASVRLALRHDPARAVAFAGFDLVALAVGTRDDLDALLETARTAGVTPGPVMVGREGRACDLVDPDGIVVRLYTHERHP